MNVLDIVLLLLFLPGIIRGLSKGFVEQGVTLLGVVASVWLAFRYSSAVCVKLKEYLSWPETALNVLAFALVLVGVLLIVLVIAKILTGVVKMATLDWLNKALGFVFSIITTGVVISILIILFDTLNVKFQLVNSPLLDESLLYGYLRDLGYKVFPFLKELLSKVS